MTSRESWTRWPVTASVSRRDRSEITGTMQLSACIGTTHDETPACQGELRPAVHSKSA